MEKTAPSGGVWGSMQQPPWWQPLPLTMVGSVADPQIADVMRHQGELGLHADDASRLNLADMPMADPVPFKFTASSKPAGLSA